MPKKAKKRNAYELKLEEMTTKLKFSCDALDRLELFMEMLQGVTAYLLNNDFATNPTPKMSVFMDKVLKTLASGINETQELREYYSGEINRLNEWVQHEDEGDTISPA